MTPATLNHLDDISRLRFARTLLENCREEQTELRKAIAILEFVERLQEQAIVRDTQTAITDWMGAIDA